MVSPQKCWQERQDLNPHLIALEASVVAVGPRSCVPLAGDVLVRAGLVVLASFERVEVREHASLTDELKILSRDIDDYGEIHGALVDSDDVGDVKIVRVADVLNRLAYSN
jgi:hypothetical protein